MSNIIVMPKGEDYIVIVDEKKEEAYLLKRYEDGLNLIPPEYVYIGEQNDQKSDKKVKKFTNCDECIHANDTIKECKQRGCIHAFLISTCVQECFDPKDCYTQKENEEE